MLHTCVEHGFYDYLLLLSKYCEKNISCIKKGILTSQKYRGGMLEIAVNRTRDLKWFELLFNLCDKSNTPPREEDFKCAIRHYEFKELPKECQSIIKEHQKKFYPK